MPAKRPRLFLSNQKRSTYKRRKERRKRKLAATEHYHEDTESASEGLLLSEEETESASEAEDSCIHNPQEVDIDSDSAASAAFQTFSCNNHIRNISGVS